MAFGIVRNNIADMEVDAIVNAANPHLRAGGGVCGAIFSAAGPELMAEACARHAGCAVGDAVVTPGFALHARYVIHAVGPVWHGGGHGEEQLLRRAYRSALEQARGLGVASVALPLISAGIYGYPPDQALAVATGEIRAALDDQDAPELDVYLVVYDRMAFAESLTRYGAVLSYVDDAYVASQPARNRARDLAVSQAPVLFDVDTGIPTSEGLDLMAAGAPGETRRAKVTPAADARGAVPAEAPCCVAAGASPDDDVRGELDRLVSSLDASFSQTVLALIDERGMTDVEAYKRANLSRQLFAKIRKDDGYRPTKQTAVALALALGLDLPQTQALLARAGYALGHASKFDVIVEYFVTHGVHDVFAVNEMLFAFDQPLLGSL